VRNSTLTPHRKTPDSVKGQIIEVSMDTENRFLTKAETILKLKRLGVIRADSGLNRLIREQNFPCQGVRSVFFCEDKIDYWLANWDRNIAKQNTAQVRKTAKLRKTLNENAEAEREEAEKARVFYASKTQTPKAMPAMEKTA